MERYDHAKIEEKWQKRWETSQPFGAADRSEKEKYYLLVEFPYPSGNLHAGHWYAFSVPDILARYLRMKGKNVLFPIGFDAFGLPAENAAIQRGINPRTWTFDNIEHMRAQLRSMGASFDWSREVVTADPEYYRWTQWQFLQFFKQGLAYRKETAVNWCPRDKTVLANEQVIEGRCERCGTEVVQRMMLQWNLKITAYADELINGLQTLNWPKQIKEAQIHWIGRSEGAEIRFALKNSAQTITIFTTRPDTILGATYVVLAPDHPLTATLIPRCENRTEVEQYVVAASKKTDRERSLERAEKTGVALRGIRAINPATNEELPVWVADYVLGHYGTGAIMAVPQYDERDRQFAETLGLPIKDAPLLNGAEVTKQVGGTTTTKYQLRDWVISRQRYWGVPIPVIHCPTCGAVPVPESSLPVELPEVEDYLPRDDGKSPLSKARAWVETSCPTCGGPAERETDTFDTFVDSSWYFLRYTDPRNEKEFAGKTPMKQWMPVDLYSGGSEHTTMHLLYSRFWHKALHSLGLVAQSEPYLRRMNRGLIMGPDGQKMSKSRGNVIDPDDAVARLGADTVRMYLAFIGPYNEVGAYPWNPNGAVGVRRFLERVWALGERVSDIEMQEETERLLHQTIQKVGEDIESLKMNTAVSALMILTNHFADLPAVPDAAYRTLLSLLCPFAPHLSHELAERRGYERGAGERWPAFDPLKRSSASGAVAVQVNGKVRGTVTLPFDFPEQEALALARKEPGVQKWLQKGREAKAVYVPGRIISFVVEPF